ncbi:LuxR C-terminal-related transcriptional regulator [Inhella sp.]|uniref:helix-turn-helix transcriptional regulator n=1 Tax=Inhella sp. TaxID=1921806 RepID=UPI0035B20ABA
MNDRLPVPIPAKPPAPWRSMLVYGLLLAVGIGLLEWLDFRRLARLHGGGLWVALIAAGFLLLGVWLGAQLVRRGRPPEPEPFAGNPRAQASLGLSDREMEVLGLIAGGLSNKEMARQLDVSPNTIKTHVARVLAKLDASRRTDALRRARELGLLP